MCGDKIRQGIGTSPYPTAATCSCCIAGQDGKFVHHYLNCHSCQNTVYIMFLWMLKISEKKKLLRTSACILSACCTFLANLLHLLLVHTCIPCSALNFQPRWNLLVFISLNVLQRRLQYDCFPIECLLLDMLVTG